MDYKHNIPLNSVMQWVTYFFSFASLSLIVMKTLTYDPILFGQSHTVAVWIRLNTVDLERPSRVIDPRPTVPRALLEQLSEIVIAFLHIVSIVFNALHDVSSRLCWNKRDQLNYFPLRTMFQCHIIFLRYFYPYNIAWYIFLKVSVIRIPLGGSS